MDPLLDHSIAISDSGYVGAMDYVDVPDSHQQGTEEEDTLSNRNYGKIASIEELEKRVNQLLAANKPFAFDVETGYTGPLRNKGALQHFAPDYVLAGISFTNNPDWARYAPINHAMAGEENLDNHLAARILWRLLRSGMGIAHNALMELNSMSRFFRDNLSDDNEVIPGTDKTYAEEVNADGGLYPIYSDTMIESMLTEEHIKKGLKDLSHDILGVPQAELITLFKDRNLKGLNATGKYVKYNTYNLRFNALPLDSDVISYACEDSALTIEHHARTYPQVKDLLIFKTELRLTPVIARMEREGMLLDWAEYERRSRDVEAFRDQFAEYVMDSFSAILGEPVNINLNSPKQVSEVLFNQMGIKPTLYTKTGAASTGEKAMRLLLSKHPEIKSLLQYREIAKLLGTYINKYLNELRYDPTGRAHPSHNQGGAVTGRFSVDGVSYQQWPKPYHYELPNGSTLDLNYKNFLIAPEGYRIIGFDYANVELRVMAGLAQERSMLEAFANGEDIHKATASIMLRVPLDQVTSKQRSVGKTLNFAIAYGSGADNIASLITAATGELCTVEQAEGYLEDYFRAFSGLRDWMDEKKLEGREVHPKSLPSAVSHWVTTAFGRKVLIAEYESPFKNVRNKGDRNAVNGMAQGTAADYMKIGMVRADAAIRKSEASGVLPKNAAKLILTIHDALEFYVRNDVTTEEFIKLIGPAVSYPVSQDWLGNELLMPVVRADWHEGYRWGTVAELSRDENGKLAYTRKIELPDKTKHEFNDSSLDGLNAQIEEFWKIHEQEELDAHLLKEDVEFEYDEEESEIIVADNFSTQEEDLLPHEITPRRLPTKPVEEIPEKPDYFYRENLFSTPTVAVEAEPDEEEPTPEDPEEEVLIPEEPEEPEWLHNKEIHQTQLRLVLPDMPTTRTWPAFQEYLKSKPGHISLVVVMPQGEITLDNVDLTPANQAEIQLIFGAAILKLDETDSVSERVLEGITL